jgi:hypothetical protein
LYGAAQLLSLEHFAFMPDSDTPKPYEQWRAASFDRAEDAAGTFGYHLIQHCRLEALKKIKATPVPTSAEEFQTQVAAAVDTALHNVMDLLEGFWPTQAGPNHRVAYELSVCVTDMSRKAVEKVAISPSLIDLPIGYWKFKDGEFR